MKRFSTTISSFLLFFLILTLPLVAQWSTNPNLNTAISTAASDQDETCIASDGAGGAIITWTDYRNGDYTDIYAQRINASGGTEWTANGVEICTATKSQNVKGITADGAGGALIAWQDYRSNNPDVYVQRVNASGIVQWTANGVALCSHSSNQDQTKIVSDGTGGAVAVWLDSRSGSYNMYAQRIDGSGAVRWTADGVAIFLSSQESYDVNAASDGAGGAIISWYDYRNGNADIFAQRIDSSGAFPWTASGVAVSTAAQNQHDPFIISDGTGGAIISWGDYRNSNESDIYAQRITSAGSAVWTANGVAICSESDYQEYPALAGDGAGGAIISWYDGRQGNSIYAQRINAGGAIQWLLNGIEIYSSPFTISSYRSMISDGTGGAVFTWQNSTPDDYTDIYGQRVDANGNFLWANDVLGVSTAPDEQDTPVLTSDGAGGAIIAWEEYRNDDGDIYAQWVNGSASNFQPLAGTILTIQDIENDQGGKVRINWHGSPNDITSGSSYQTTSYGVWRKIPDGMTSVTAKNPQRPFVNDTLGANYDFIMTVGAVQSSTYNVVAPTLDDSSASGNNAFTFLITSHTAEPLIYFVSASMSGYSVDNLAPTAAQALIANVVGGTTVNLTWDANTVDPDVSKYEVHRSLVSGFTPDGVTKIGETTDNSFLDGSPVSGSTNYYRIVTRDIHDNQSLPSVQASAELAVTVLYSMNDKWNMLSVPLTVNNYAKTTVYPSAVSDAFKYQAGYVAQTTLANGTGYWLKFNGSQSVSMTGFLRTEETIPVAEGWNMLGSISDPITPAQITSNPPGLVTSQFFGYDNGYYNATFIESGKAYWVKVNAGGTLTLSSVVSTQYSVSKITIVPTNELPPPPPEGDGNISSNNLIIPSEFALAQNYPNPFNPSTVIRYQLPVDSWVTLKVYNTLGGEVATLVDGLQVAGYRFVEWDASGLPSGVYYYRMTAGTYAEIKTLMLMK